MENEEILVGIKIYEEDTTYYVHLTPAQIEEYSDETKFRELYYSLKAQELMETMESQNKGESATSDSENHPPEKNNAYFDEYHKWTNNSIKLLLQIRLSMEKEFMQPKGKKNKLWTKIAGEMKEIGGYKITSNECDLKYRNLLSTYRKNKEKKSKTGESKIVWEYFETFDEVLGHKPSSCPPAKLLTSSIPNEEENENNKNEKRKNKKTENQHDKLSTPKKKREMSIAQYLANKDEREERRFSSNAAGAGPSGIHKKKKNSSKEKANFLKKSSSSSESE